MQQNRLRTKFCSWSSFLLSHRDFFQTDIFIKLWVSCAGLRGLHDKTNNWSNWCLGTISWRVNIRCFTGCKHEKDNSTLRVGSYPCQQLQKEPSYLNTTRHWVRNKRAALSCNGWITSVKFYWRRPL